MAEPTPSTAETVNELAVPSPGRWVVVTRSAVSVLRRLFHLAQFLAGAVIGAGLVHELEISAWQAHWFHRIAQEATFELRPGVAERMTFPAPGPFDWHRGYAQLPALITRLYEAGFRISAQSQQSKRLQWLLQRGISPPYREPPIAGLVVRGPDGTVLLDMARGQGVVERFDDLPRDLLDALLFIENRELLAPLDPRSNPAIEWDRLLRASALFVAHRWFGLSTEIQGGSTLAVQLEKYRHSPNGRTAGALDKLRQIVAASLKAYRNGEDTRTARQEIVVDYLNTLPLSAAPGFGEVYGLGAGLRAWFGTDLQTVLEQLRQPASSAERARAFKQVLLLFAAVRAPSGYLLGQRAALEQRVHHYLDLFVHVGLMDPEFARAVRETPAEFLSSPSTPEFPPFVERKGVNALRTHLMGLLGISNVYDLHRLHLTVDSTVDTELQQHLTQLLLDLRSPDFLRAKGLVGERLLRSGDPTKVLYSIVLFERTPMGNLARVHTDNLDRPFDINEGIKMELGSTAKARTLAHYLEVVEELFHDWQAARSRQAGLSPNWPSDPISQWALGVLQREPSMPLERLFQLALERRYSASPGEVFFTGGGVHTFGNFDRDDNGRVLTVREAMRRSTNLVFIRLMRDLVRYHQARLPYDPARILADPHDPVRQAMLQEIAEREVTDHLKRAYRRFRGLPEPDIAARLLGKRADSARHLAILFFAWKKGNTPKELAAWLSAHGVTATPTEVSRLFRAYSNPRLTPSDFGFLLSRHPVDVWVAGQLVAEPNADWQTIHDRARSLAKEVSGWLLRSKNRRAQDLRLRIRIEQDAFARMTPYWQRLGFPFSRLVPTLATAIGNSSDRPIALAEFMGILVNDGVRRPLRRVQRLHFAEGTPYETILEPRSDVGERVMSPELASAMRAVLAEVVENGTARRLKGAFVDAQGNPVVVGGKTGSGDNRFKTFRRGGGVIASRPVNRTATFAFFISDRYFGVVTAHVPGRDAAEYEFTSALPVSILKLAAPAINARLAGTVSGQPPAHTRSSVPARPAVDPGGEQD